MESAASTMFLLSWLSEVEQGGHGVHNYHIKCWLQSFPLIQWDFLLGVGPYDFPTIVCIQNRLFEFEWKATYFGSLRAKLILSPLGMPKWVWLSTNQYRIYFIQISKHAQKTYQTWKVLCAKQPSPDQKPCFDRG